ncbi:hypothetical protein MLD38_032868 [Melastoma candidum]|uniref:Uncharacterized protein n=1 Tax=Melastoma candidum TaxID=119954 RepID=A0ACB9M4S1_9MYRT|nr:hypothetical protein MLD38_032868 [Melastoma candidum]
MDYAHEALDEFPLEGVAVSRGRSEFRQFCLWDVIFWSCYFATNECSIATVVAADSDVVEAYRMFFMPRGDDSVLGIERGASMKSGYLLTIMLMGVMYSDFKVVERFKYF